jgi:tetratricopeptide (TPR) repeat protein
MSSQKIYQEIQYYKIKDDYIKCIECYNKLLAIEPKNELYMKELGEVYEVINNPEKAIEVYKNMLLINPKNGVILNQIGCCYNKLLDYKKSIEYFKKVLAIKNDIAVVYKNIGICHVNLREFKHGEINFLIAEKLGIGSSDINEQLAQLYFYTKNYDKSINYFKNIPNIYDLPEKAYPFSFPCLANKNFKLGFELYENRLKTNKICQQTKQNMRVEIPWIVNWDGKMPCAHLLIIYEQGIGDNIQYFRFIIELSKKYPDMKITYFCKNTIQHILKEYKNIDIVLNLNDTSVFNYKLYIMSLPYILELDNITYNTEQYIKINDEKCCYWKNKLSEHKNLKIGFIYYGLLSSFIEKTIPLEEWKIICDLNVDLICLHKKDSIQSNIDFLDKITIHDIDVDVPFEDTIAILQNIDLLITVDTSIAHLAGVLGVKTWLLLGYCSDWRWFNDDKNSVWYKNVELMRITENVELKNILKNVKQRLI